MKSWRLLAKILLLAATLTVFLWAQSVVVPFSHGAAATGADEVVLILHFFKSSLECMDQALQPVPRGVIWSSNASAFKADAFQRMLSWPDAPGECFCF